MLQTSLLERISRKVDGWFLRFRKSILFWVSLDEMLKEVFEKLNICEWDEIDGINDDLGVVLA